MTVYTHGHGAAALAHSRRTADNSCAYLLPSLTPDMRLLDVGCGPGSISLDLAGFVREVVGVDSVAAPLDAARSAAHARGVLNASFAEADVSALPYDDASFDVVHAHQVLQHVLDPVAALREMARVCRPGGIIAARDADYQAMCWWPETPGLDLWLRTYRAMALRNGAQPDAGRRLLSWAHQAGLDQVQASASTWCYADAEAVTWWSRSWQQRATEERFVDQARAVGVDDAGVAAIVDGFGRWADSPDAWWVVLNAEVLAIR